MKTVYMIGAKHNLHGRAGSTETKINKKARLHGISTEGPFHISESESFGNSWKHIGNPFFKNLILEAR